MLTSVHLRFENGNFEHGFDRVLLSINIAQTQQSIELKIELPPAPLIDQKYQSWQDKYSNLFQSSGSKNLLPSLDTENFARGFNEKIPTNFSFDRCKQDCESLRNDLHTQINQWLAVIKSQLEAGLHLDLSEILLILHTQNIASQRTRNILHRLPWNEWDYFKDNLGVEVVLCLSESEPDCAEVTDDTILRKVRITSIFGDDKNISIESDRELIAKLEKQGAKLINIEQPQRSSLIKLWDESCDILFYSGHSESSLDGTFGLLRINNRENLNLEEIKNTLREAIKKGLKLAIFNSCDGLGLAKQLVDLHLPYIIVWREPVPDKIAIGFTQYFFSSYTEGKCLFTSVRDARIKLVELTNKENLMPGLNSLPIICKSTSNPPPYWEDLGGLTGKLPCRTHFGLSSFEEEDKA